MTFSRLLTRGGAGSRLDGAEALELLESAHARDLASPAEALTLDGFGGTVTYSRKVFIPLTQLCRDVCHYCTFAQAPRRLAAPYLTTDQVREIVRAGMQAGCKEALFTLGDKPELRYSSARRALQGLGAASTLEYLERIARLVLDESQLLPHLNPGVMDKADLERLRPVSASMGLMLESASERLCGRGGPHHGSPDKAPAARLATLRAAGELGIAMTTGLLIGIGETRRERIESLLALRDIHDEHGNLQELIIQNFRAKPGTKMARAPEPDLEEQLWTISAARLIFGPHMSIQAPPNLQPDALHELLRAGVNDWGGVSPVTPDHVNPEAPWPHLEHLAKSTAAVGRHLSERLALGPAFAQACDRWVAPAMATRVRRMSDARGLARTDSWYCGSGSALPPSVAVQPARDPRRGATTGVSALLARARDGEALAESDIVRLFAVDGTDFERVVAAADALREMTVGDTVTYVVNRNINYTNICLYHCGFCAFSKGRGSADLRGPAYNLDLREIARRTVEAAQAGATEVCLQGGIHPSFTGQTYLDIVAAVKEAVPDMHVHAFSALEIWHGAHTLGLSLADFLHRLREAGLSTLPGTAAEILDDEIRMIICPDKLRTGQWLEVIRTAHRAGLKTTSTIMYGHVEQPVHWARHLLRLRELQMQTGGISEFVPLGFVHMEAPLWRKGRTRSGPTFREAVLMHAVPRLVLHPWITNIQASWVKLGVEGAAACLRAGANDLGGTLMNESITRAAGGVHGQLLDAAQLIAIARSLGRPARQRSTLYGGAHDGPPRGEPRPPRMSSGESRAAPAATTE
jgi:FO synthase